MLRATATKDANLTHHTGLISAYEWPIINVGGATLNIDDVAIPNMLRFLDCKAFCDDHVLRVWQSPNVDILKSLKYAAISYVWRGVHQPSVASSFMVEAAEDGDRVCLDVLRTVCQFSLRAGAPYIWLDRLSIMQKNAFDKDWQIRHMADIYRQCTVCFVLPGGIGGLVSVDEPTSWIDRSWTLQEALLPPQVICLVRWDLGRGYLQVSTMAIEVIDVDGVIGLELVHGLILGAQPEFKRSLASNAASAPRASMTHNNDGIQLRFSFLSVHRTQLLEFEVAFQGRHKDQRENAIWRSALMRTSTRDVDVIYSIMGLFGVQLDPAQYRGRQEATLALVQAVMAKGGRANWFTASLTSPIPSVLCTMPPMPVPLEQSAPSIQLPDGRLVDCRPFVTHFGWYLRDAPTGTVDELGFVEFTAPISPISFGASRRTGTTNTRAIKAAGRKGRATCWGEPGTHAVVVGTTVLYSTASVARCIWKDTVMLMLVKRNANGGWHKTGMATVAPEVVERWPKQIVRIGAA